MRNDYLSDKQTVRKMELLESNGFNSCAMAFLGTFAGRYFPDTSAMSASYPRVTNQFTRQPIQIDPHSSVEAAPFFESSLYFFWRVAVGYLSPPSASMASARRCHFSCSNLSSMSFLNLRRRAPYTPLAMEPHVRSHLLTSSSETEVKLAFIVVYRIRRVEPPTWVPVYST